MNGILNLDFMHYTTVISLEMSDEPHLAYETNKVINGDADIVCGNHHAGATDYL